MTDFEDIKITRIIDDERSVPPPASDLYPVLLALSRTPPPEWEDKFIKSWDSPTQYGTRHRPGIASVEGDKIVLDGTTVEEIEKYHRSTLMAAIQNANEQYRALRSHEKMKQEQERVRKEQHRRKMKEISKRIKF